MPRDRDLVPLSRFTALLGRGRGAKRVEELLFRPDAAAQVAELAVPDLYYLVKEVGDDDAHALVELATPEQLQGCLDLDLWQGDRLYPEGLRPWLDALLAAGFEKVTPVWRELDQELTALLIARSTRIYDIVEEEVPDDEEPPFYPTPDRFFMVKITVPDEDDVRRLMRLLDDLYRGDAELARHTLRAARSEPLAYLEEQSYRWRSGRMQDLGFAEVFEALELYRPIDPATVGLDEGSADKPSTTATLPATWVEAARPAFLGKVLAEIADPHEARRLEAALVTLANRALAADRVPPSALEAAAAGAGRAAATLSLGLEALARGDVDRGRAALAGVALARVFRLGYTITLQLRRALLELGPWITRLDEREAEVASALGELRPAFARVLDSPPETGSRPFSTLADVARVTMVLAAIAQQVQIVLALGVDPAELPPATTLGDLGRTAVVRAALGEGAVFRPLSSADLGRFLANCIADGHLKPAAATAALAAFSREYAAPVGGWIRDLEDLLGRIDFQTPLDPRFIGGVVLE